jgi:hypothetical protein
MQMRGYEMVRRRRARVVVVVPLAVITVVLVFVSSAVAGAPGRVGFPPAGRRRRERDARGRRTDAGDRRGAFLAELAAAPSDHTAFGPILIGAYARRPTERGAER